MLRVIIPQAADTRPPHAVTTWHNPPSPLCPRHEKRPP